MKEKLFNRNEIQQIIRQASLLQNKEENSFEDEIDGLTKKEIIELCKEAGIKASNITFAIHEILRENFTKKSGYTNTTVYDFVIIKTLISEEECWEIVSHELSYHVPNTADYKIYTSKETGKWSYKDILNKQIAARIEPFDEGFIIKLTDKVSESDPRTKSINISSFISVALTGFTYLNITESIPAVVFVLLATFGISYLFSHEFEMNRRKKRLSKLMEIGTIVGEAIPES